MFEVAFMFHNIHLNSNIVIKKLVRKLTRQSVIKILTIAYVINKICRRKYYRERKG